MKKLVTVMNTIMIRKLTVVPAILGITALIISACSAGGGGGGGGGGNSESGNNLAANKNTSSELGQYSGSYSMTLKRQLVTCTDGVQSVSDTGYFFTGTGTTAIVHQGDRISAYNTQSGEETMTGTVYGTRFDLSVTSSLLSSVETDGVSGSGSMSGNFNSSGWSGEMLITARDQNLQCTFTLPFYGSKISTLEVQSPQSTLTRTTEELSDIISHEGATRILEKAFGVLSEADGQSGN